MLIKAGVKNQKNHLRIATTEQKTAETKREQGNRARLRNSRDYQIIHVNRSSVAAADLEIQRSRHA